MVLAAAATVLSATATALSAATVLLAEVCLLQAASEQTAARTAAEITILFMVYSPCLSIYYTKRSWAVSTNIEKEHYC